MPDVDRVIAEGLQRFGEPNALTNRRVSAAVSVHFPMAPEATWTTVVEADLPSILTGTPFLPAIASVDGFGFWGVEGMRRGLVLADGSTLSEVIIEAKEPTLLHYRIYGITGIFGRLTNGADARFRFTPAASGTNVEWTYVYDSRNLFTHLLVVFIIKVLWRPYMRASLSRLRAQTVG